MPYTVGDICRLIAKRKSSSEDAPQASKNIFEGVESKIPSTAEQLWQESVKSSTAVSSRKERQKKKNVSSENPKTGYIPLGQSSEDEAGSSKRIKRQDSPSRLARTVFVGHLPAGTSKKVIYNHFKQFGKIESIRLRCAIPPKLTIPKRVAVIKKEFHPESSTISAFVVFSSEPEAQAALSLNATVLNGRHLRVDIASRSKNHDHKHSIFIGNIPCNVDEEDIWEFFGDCGNVLAVRLIRDRWTGIGKGFGYVLFENADGVSLALQKDGLEFQDRKIRITRSLANASKDKFEERMNRKSSATKFPMENVKSSFVPKGTYGNKGKKKKVKKARRKKLRERKQKTVAEIIRSADKSKKS